MVERGYYQMHRGWQDHPVFGREPYSERDAWEWLIANASHTDTVVRVAGVPVTVERGQLCYSVRFLAERWRWSKSKVHRFLGRMAKWDMIRTCAKSGTANTVVTVCNYELYQAPQTQSGTAAGQQRDSSGTNKKNDKKDNKTTRGIYSPEFEEAWSVYPRDEDSKAAAFKAWTARIREGVAAREMIEGTERYNLWTQHHRTEQRFIKRAVTFYGPDEHWNLPYSLNGREVA